jgi:hypothetical protein
VSFIRQWIVIIIKKWWDQKRSHPTNYFAPTPNGKIDQKKESPILCPDFIITKAGNPIIVHQANKLE